MTAREQILSEMRELERQGSNMAFFKYLAYKFGGSLHTYKKVFYEIQRKDGHKALYQFADQAGFNADEVNHYWYKGKHISAHVKPSGPNFEEQRKQIIDEISKYTPQYEKVDYSAKKQPHLLVIDPADVHIGKLALKEETGHDYDMQEARERVIQGVAGILRKSKGFDIEQILFVAGNDILHTDNTTRGTTRGTPQDTDGMWYEHFQVAKEIYAAVIEYLTCVAPVHVVFNPSNHDYQSGYFLADVVKTWFKDNPNTTFDTSIASRKYYRYFDNLIGTTHGDTAKPDKLPLLMANEAKADWAATEYRYLYTHHVHHKTAKDHVGVTIESLRSPSPPDAWHARMGYKAPMAIEGFIHARDQGQVARITHYFQ